MNDLTDLILSNAMSNANSFKEGYEAGFKAAQKIVDKFVKEWLAEMDQKLAEAKASTRAVEPLQAQRLQGSGGEQVGMHNSLLDDEKFRQQVRDYVNGDTPFAPGGT